MHTSTYGYEQRVTLGSVFVPQFALESVLAPEMPREIQKRLGETGTSHARLAAGVYRTPFSGDDSGHVSLFKLRPYSAKASAVRHQSKSAAGRSELLLRARTNVRKVELFRTLSLDSTPHRSQAPTRLASAGELWIVWSLRLLLRGRGPLQFR